MDAETYVNLTLEIMPKMMVQITEEMKKIKDEMTKSGGEIDLFYLIRVFAETVNNALQPYKHDIEKFGLSVDEFSTWKKEHNSEIERYLAENPDFEQKIQEIEQQLHDILEF